MAAQLDWKVVHHHAMGGVELSTLTVLFTIVSELCSLDTVRHVWKQPNGKGLYMKAIVYNLSNHYVLGVPTYVIAAMFCCAKKETAKENGDLAFAYATLFFLWQVLFVLIAQSLQYYYVHKVFHGSPKLYSMFHRFHHRFNTHVPPVAANAVTAGEYALAYVIPFGNAALVGRIHIPALRAAIVVTSLLNILVHTPKLESWSGQWVPSLWVSTLDHLNHHRKLQVHYASPCFNIDNILCWIMADGGERNQRKEDDLMRSNDRRD
jgi:sterol desaturase/sphingolipid hydroxylase (fatty acid hydroxylase superfamily)